MTKLKINNRFIKYTLISFSFVLVIYFGMSMFFQSHFYYNTMINGVNASLKTYEEVNNQMASRVEAYTLNLEERGGKKEEIKAADIGLKFISGNEIKSIKYNQNPYKWISAIFKTSESQLSKTITYDENLLKNYIDKLNCLDSKNIIEPKSAGLIYSEAAGYHVAEEVIGNKIKKDALYSNIVQAILNGESSINLETANCYENPKYTSASQKIIDTQNILNKYLKSKITYTYNGGSKVVDSSLINTWIEVDEDLAVTFDNKKIKSFVNKLSSHYNTYGKKRNFATSLNKTVNVGGGDYGWRVNVTEETNDLIKTIKEGKTINKEPKYLQKALSQGPNDIGDTYVEINLTMQHIWFYKNGKLIVDGDVVSGNVSKNNGTPSGIYKLKYKEKNAVLNGEDYSTPVTYWMPFNGNIGIHDATWRKKFGGEIYMTSGSHGCVNSPYKVANTIYDNVSAGTPVVCFY